MNKLLKVFIYSLYSSTSHAFNYIDYINDHIYVDGYVGYTYTADTLATDDSIIESFPELGAIINYSMTDELSTFMQFKLSKSAMKYPETLLIYGFAKYENITSNNITYEFKAGKLRHDFLLHSSELMNPSTSPGVIPPQAMYWHNLSSTVISGYGINMAFGYNGLHLGYTISEHIVTDNVRESYIWAGHQYVPMESSFGSHHLLNLNYTPIDEYYKIKSSFTSLKFSKSSPPIFVYALGGTYDDGKYLAEAEFMILTYNEAMSTKNDKVTVGYSITAGYYPYDNILLFTNYNEYVGSNISTSKFHYVDTMNKWSDVSIGTKINYKDVYFGMDIHHVSGGRVLKPETWNDENIKSWWMLGLSVTYDF